MHPYLVLLVGACVSCATCAGVALARDPARRSSQLAALMLAGVAFWAACEVAWNSSRDAATALAWMHLSTPGWILIGPLVMHLFMAAGDPRGRRSRRGLALLYAGSLGLLVAGCSTPWVIAEAVPTSWGWGYRVGPLYPVYYALTCWGMFGALPVTIRALKRLDSPAERRQRPWIVAGASIPFGVASLTDAVLPMAGVQVPHLGTTAFAVLGCIIAWVTLYHGHSLVTPGTFSDEILATFPDGVAVLGRDRRIRSANAALADLSGYSRDELTGMRAYELLRRRLAKSAPAGGEPGYELVTRRGDRIPLEVAWSDLHDRQGYAVGSVLVARDLREMEQLRGSLVTSARLAAVGQLAAGIAHEINNPMAFIGSNLGMLRDHWKTVRAELEDAGRAERLKPVLLEGNELIDEALAGVSRASEIVRGVKGFSHAGGGEREPADLNPLLDEVLRMASIQFGRRVRIETHYTLLPAVRCNPQELKQVFLNLLVNAGQAIDGGGVIRLSSEAGDGEARVLVEDDGCGIPAENRDRIFDPFFTTKPAGEGTGLGLGIAHQIVRRHGGAIEVTSQRGQGTRFCVRLPAE